MRGEARPGNGLPRTYTLSPDIQSVSSRGPRPSAQLTDTDNPTYSYVDYPFNTDAADGWTSTGDSTAPHCWYTSPTVYFSCPLGYY